MCDLCELTVAVGSGIVNGLAAISKGASAGNYVVGALALIIGVAFGLVALCDFILIVKVSRPPTQ